MMLRYALEILGTVAFAVSGALVGIRKKMDILGVVTLGLITAVGGGILRDLIIGVVPPAAFSDPVWAVLAIAVSVIVFLPFISRHIDLDRFIWILIDSVGLGAFTIIGVLTGIPYGSRFLSIFLGVVTGVGGGVIRDICANDIPMIFVRHFYACPCIIGAIACVLLYPAGNDLAVVTGFALILVLRLLAAKFRWHLPKAK